MTAQESIYHCCGTEVTPAQIALYVIVQGARTE